MQKPMEYTSTGEEGSVVVATTALPASEKVKTAPFARDVKAGPSMSSLRL